MYFDAVKQNQIQKNNAEECETEGVRSSSKDIKG